MSISVFLSTVSDEFRVYRDQLRSDLTRHNVEVKVQEDFKALGDDTLDKLDVYIAHCDAVVHLVGEMAGSAPGEREQQALLHKYPNLLASLPLLDDVLRRGMQISYTQWEAWLALYHGKLLLIAKAEPSAPRGPKFAATEQSRATQSGHLGRLKMVRRYPDFTFANAADLAKHIAYTAILDLLVTAYAKEAAEARDVAEGFIREMAARVAADPHLDLEGMKQAVRTAIDIYEQEIAGARTQSNLGGIVDEVLANAKRLANEGKSRLARAALRRTADTLRREEEERRASYTERVRVLFGRERDIALAAYDGEAAAEAILAMAESLHGDQTDARRDSLIAEGDRLDEFGNQRGSNVHLIAAIGVRRATLRLAAGPDAVGFDQNKLGLALATLGGRESGTARLEEAVTAYRAALEERTRERVPLDWATTQNNLGAALSTLGERESGTARLEEAVTAYRAALEERTRERVPLQWATTQNNLGAAFWRLGERESGTARLEEAVTAYRAALEERTRERVPLDWAGTQNNLGAALWKLGERESGTARLEEAVTAYHAALEERTRERVPLQWAMTQNNLGNALRILGEWESGTARLEEAVTAYRAALEEWTRERVPLDWATTQNNLGNALWKLGERESGAARLEEAVSAYRAALEEWTHERVPLDWAGTQNNLGNALWKLGERESGTARLEEAVSAYRAALEERTRERVPLDWAITQNNLGAALSTLGERESGTARLEEAVSAYRAALEERTRERVPLQWATTQNNLGAALWRLGGRESGTARLEEAVAAFDACLTVAGTASQEAWVQEVRSHRDETRVDIIRRQAMK
jgi:tetratricopeptide (TPR) repeat protein